MYEFMNIFDLQFKTRDHCFYTRPLIVLARGFSSFRFWLSYRIEHRFEMD